MISANRTYEGRTDDHVYVGLEGAGTINQALFNVRMYYANRDLRIDNLVRKTSLKCGNPVTNEYSWDRTEGLDRSVIFND